MVAQFVVTPWRDSKELLEVRACLFPKDGDEDRREQAVNKIFAWRLRKHQIPLLLESTADIIDVMLQEEKHGLEHNALRLLYSTAVSRFVTGLSDSLTDLTRLRPSFFPSGQTLLLPPSLLETRHCIVHRQLPSLATLKSAARQSLEWLWEWYWSQLDVAFSQARRRGGDESQEWKSREEVKTEIQAIMKSYVRARKIEITMSRTTASFEAAQTAFGTYTTLLSASERACTHQTLLDLLVTEKAILPSDKKLGSRMSGAFIVWSPLLVLLCSTPSLHSTSLVVSLVRRFLQAMNGPSPFGVEKEEDPVKEGMHAWLLRVSTHPDFMGPRALAGNGWETKFVENVLADLCVAPSSWNLKALEGILDAHEDLPNREAWVSVLDAAMDEGEEEEVDMEGEGLRSEEISIEEQVQEELEAEAENEGTEAQSARVKVKTIGPQKRVGLWRPTYIGVLPVGWEDDE